jgi:hypothetical protein
MRPRGSSGKDRRQADALGVELIDLADEVVSNEFKSTPRSGDAAGINFEQNSQIFAGRVQADD